ncbi:MAG: alanine--tRNA ligase [Puniceicoccales bacterium]|jgi:alanyl-tRNA synthetase|nr:alanine--tRNA ligase [Puniceicoccales bacterium]
MDSAKIRSEFLDFFSSHGHKILPSASLLPESPNLLFTNAGMNQFVPYFLGSQEPIDRRVADVQTCIRAGGKHNDLDDVGFDTYHHTFFEMLGNWSFGDYFKKEAIELAWELLTKVWKFPKNRLYATVYHPNDGEPAEFDQESFDIWSEIFASEQLDPEVHIKKCSRKDNFWMMGDTGPCGPCSEIHMDLTESGDTNGNIVNAGSCMCLEIWNLVFIQYNANSDGSFKKLAQKHVDTGMGLERVVGIMATTNNFSDFSRQPSNYDSDLFSYIFAELERLSGLKYAGTISVSRSFMSDTEKVDFYFRAIADHIRTLTFGIADGILPGNEGRNYVLRRILRRAVLFGKKMGLPSGFFAKLSEVVIEKMGKIFGQLIDNKAVIYDTLVREEISFDRTLGRGIRVLEKICSSNKSGMISGEDVFLLYDTYGFPIDLTKLMAEERGLGIDMEAAEQEMDRQRQRARSSQKKVSLAVASVDKEKISFVGYSLDKNKKFFAEVVGIVDDKTGNFVILDSTPFFAEMGGEVGDTGSLCLDGRSIEVLATIRNESNLVLHRLPKNVGLKLGDRVECVVDMERRKSIQRNHTATHLLHFALRDVLGDHVKQAGSLVDSTKLRFDFNHFSPLSDEQIHDIEYIVTRCILENLPVKCETMPFAEKPDNCIAFFGEKYGKIVRVVTIGCISCELCGGCHAASTGEIGFFKILSESAISAGVRRIEAVSGFAAFSFVEKVIGDLKNISKKLSCSIDKVFENFTHMIEHSACMESQLKMLKNSKNEAVANALVNNCSLKNDLKFILDVIDVENIADLKSIALLLSKKLSDGFWFVLCGKMPDRSGAVLISCSRKALANGIKANLMLKKLSEKIDIKGGGNEELAMGGVKQSSLFSERLETLKNL